MPEFCPKHEYTTWNGDEPCPTCEANAGSEGAMSQQVVYGYPCVVDPHDFTPDAECCSPKELEAHRLACANYGKPSYQPNRGCFATRNDDGTLVMHALRTSWGIGTNLVRICDECRDFLGPTFVECHECGRDFCEWCWYEHAGAETP
jgi:hypothetical protein